MHHFPIKNQQWSQNMKNKCKPDLDMTFSKSHKYKTEIFNTYEKSTTNKAPYLIMLGSQVRSLLNLTKHSHPIYVDS